MQSYIQTDVSVNILSALNNGQKGTLREIVGTGGPTWSTIHEVNGLKIPQKTAADRLNKLEKLGYLKSVSDLNPKNRKKIVFTPTLAGAWFVFCESYTEKRWYEVLTEDIFDALSTLAKYSPFISACSRTSIWRDFKALNDLQFATIVFNAASGGLADLGSDSIAVEVLDEQPELFEAKFCKNMIQSIIDHAVYLYIQRHLGPSNLYETPIMHFLLKELIPELFNGESTASPYLLIGWLKSRQEEYSMTCEALNDTIGEFKIHTNRQN